MIGEMRSSSLHTANFVVNDYLLDLQAQVLKEMVKQQADELERKQRDFKVDYIW